MTANQDVPEGKRTDLGLYVTAKEAFELWKADAANVKILDVRTPEEYGFVGHARMARNIPVVFVKYQWDADAHKHVLVPNADFVDAAKKYYSFDDKILLTCRSGGRGALAVNALAAAGFSNVYNITDGMEGDMEKDPASAFCGQRMKNGWKNSGSPWTYDTDPELLWLEG